MAIMQMGTYLKAGLQGGTGTGKSTTSALLQLGLSVELHGKAPVLVRDSEPGWHFLKPLFDAEGVNLIIDPGRDYKGMHDALKRAVREGCCGFVTDSITHPWAELLERFADRTGRVPFHKFNQIKPLWNDWTVDFMNAPLHAIACGRLGFEYFYQEAEDGKQELIKGDTKMKAGGSESFGYEPHLTLEMTRQQVRNKSGKISGVKYNALVLKDRSRALNGKEFSFADLHDYKPGGYREVLKAFMPHIEMLRQIAGVTMGKQTSEAIIPNGDADFFRLQKLRQAALEDWDATMSILWPGQTAPEKRNRAVVGECITGVRSRTKFEAYTLEQMQSCVGWLMALEHRIKLEGMPANEKDLLAQVELAKEDYRANPQPTLLELRLKESVAAVTEPEGVAVPF